MAQRNYQDLKHSEEEYFQKAENLIPHSCSVLRSIFRRRWEETTGSSWSEASTEELLTGIGKDIIKNKKFLKGGNLEEWDMSLLWNLLKQIKWKKYKQESVSLQKRENGAIEKLVQLRNKAAHNSSKKLNEENYKKVEKIFRSHLEDLGVSPEEIEGIIEKAGVVTPVSGWESAKKIFLNGDKKFQSGNYSEAIELYSEALQVPNLLQSNQAILLEKRAEARVALAEGMRPGSKSTDNLDKAMTDIRKSLEYEKDSWKAHEIIGKIYKHKNEFKLAVEHLNRALAISPRLLDQSEVKAELDCCKLLLGKIERQEHSDSRDQPMTFEEGLQLYTIETGITITKDMWSKMETVAETIIPGQSHVQTGHRYVNGWDVNQDYLEASRHYAKADKVGNSEGTYNLAVLYLYGKGVKVWVEHAIELMEKAASMPPEIKMKNGMKMPSVGVRAAQHCLGLIYEKGVHVPPDTKVAAMWYEKAAKNGLGMAANNLAILYSEGRGVKYDMKKAVMYWKLGVQQKDMNAAASLHAYFMKEMEPTLARIMFDRSMEYGRECLKNVQEQVYEQINQMEKQREQVEPGLIAFEKANNLNGKGMTFNERLLRKLSESGGATNVLANSLNDLDEIVNSHTRWAGKVKGFNPYDLMQRALEGSITAQSLIQVVSSLADFEHIWGTGPPFTPDQTKQLVDLFYFCIIREHHIIRFEDNFVKRIMQFIEAQLRINGHAKSELDKKLRICYFWGPTRDVLQVIEILKVGLERYPDEVFYYDLLSAMYGNMKNYELGLKVAENGLSRFPNHIELRYNKAVHTRLLQGDGEIKNSSVKVRSEYERFLEKAPKDHRKVPEAYYAIATSFVSDQDKDNILRYYDMGKEAEKNQLSCYLPYDSSSKSMLEGLVNLMKNGLAGQGETKISKTGEEEKPSTSASTPTTQAPKPVRNNKVYLEDEWRFQRIKEHRTIFHSLRARFAQNKKKPGWRNCSVRPRLQQKLPWRLTDLKSIKLIEIDASKDGIYEGRLLNLTIIEDPIIGVFPAIHTLAEDDDGDVTRIHVYNVPHDSMAEKQYGYGSRLAVIHPYMRIGANDQLPFIRVDDPRCIIYNEGVENMCRYCGEANAPHTCSRCKRAKYCSRDCQKKDWNILQHKLICEKLY